MGVIIHKEWLIHAGQEGKKNNQLPSGVKLRHSDWKSSALHTELQPPDKIWSSNFPLQPPDNSWCSNFPLQPPDNSWCSNFPLQPPDNSWCSNFPLQPPDNSWCSNFPLQPPDNSWCSNFPLQPPDNSWCSNFPLQPPDKSWSSKFPLQPPDKSSGLPKFPLSILPTVIATGNLTHCISHSLCIIHLPGQQRIQWNLRIMKVLGQPIFSIIWRFLLLRGSNVLKCMQMVH